jgi:amino acid adenylation domain-containing protein
LLVDECLALSASRYPDKEALVCGARRVTYRQIDESANRLGHGLREAGIREGDRVVVFLENGVEAVVSFFGVLRAGAVFVPVGSTIKADKLAYILDDSGASALIYDERSATTAAAAMRAAPPPLRKAIVVGGGRVNTEVAGFDALTGAGQPANPPGRHVIDLDLAALIYTSGSTANPKGVMLSHLNMVAAATSIGRYLDNAEDDVILNVLPLSFDYGLYQVLLAFQAGARLILERSFVYPTVVFELLERERVTGLPLVPTLAALLLKHDLRTFDLALRYITNTGAVLPPAHIEALRSQLPGVRIFSMYGLTECKRVSYLSPEEIDERPTSVGQPMDNVEVYVRDDEGTLSTVGTGELVVRGSNVMVGYWHAPELTSRTLEAGPWPGQPLLRTGDRFRIDENGYMYFLGRLDDTIKCRGRRVSPREVENAIYELSEVREAAVVGQPDPILGTAIVAFVSVSERDALTERDLQRHCAERLEDFMVPTVVRLVSALPKTESGKIDRRRLQDSLQGRSS